MPMKNGAALPDTDQSNPVLSQAGCMSKFWFPEILYKMLFEPEFLMIAKGRFSSE